MKRIIIICLSICISIYAHAQATDLVIDCQTPGWLSSKINYGDQQTVRNLKVTGYINSFDLNFIGTLISKRNLDGELDLSECNVVSETSAEEDNLLSGLGLTVKDSIRVYRIPRTVTKANNCTENLYVDTLYFDCQMHYISQSCLYYEKVDVGHLYIGEQIDSIPNNAFVRDPGREYAGACTKVKSVHFSSNTKYIGSGAFEGSELSTCNFNDLINLEYLGRANFINGNWHTFGLCAPDTIIIPTKLKSFPLNAFIYKNGAHIFIGENTKVLEGGTSDKFYYDHSGSGLTFHINQKTPPNITYWFRYSNWFPEATIYVPKGAKQAYLNSGWKNATIIELNPVETVALNEHQITLNKEEQFALSVSVIPEDADDKTIEWKSEDKSVTTVDANGVVTAIKEGETKIYATSTATGIQDICTVIVRKNVTSISLNELQVSLANIGDTKQLVALIAPDYNRENEMCNFSKRNVQFSRFFAPFFPELKEMERT